MTQTLWSTNVRSALSILHGIKSLYKYPSCSSIYYNKSTAPQALTCDNGLVTNLLIAS